MKGRVTTANGCLTELSPTDATSGLQGSRILWQAHKRRGEVDTMFVGNVKRGSG